MAVEATMAEELDVLFNGCKERIAGGVLAKLARQAGEGLFAAWRFTRIHRGRSSFGNAASYSIFAELRAGGVGADGLSIATVKIRVGARALLSPSPATP